MYRDVLSGTSADALHAELFSGAIARFRSLPELAALVGHAREFLETRLSSDPTLIHRTHEQDLAERCAELQRAFANDRAVQRLWQAVFEAAGLDPASSARDRLLLRFQPPQPQDGSLPWARSTATVSFHRDTWGTNLYAQVNWWAPVYPVTHERTFAFLPELFARPLANNSEGYDIAELIRRNRGNGPPVGPGEMVPRLLKEVDLSTALPVIIEPGELIAFSSQHAHVGSGNNTDRTRISIETRTLRTEDQLAGRGAPNADGRGRWIAFGMFRRLSDGKPLHALLEMAPLEPFRGPWTSLRMPYGLHQRQRYVGLGTVLHQPGARTQQWQERLKVAVSGPAGFRRGTRDSSRPAGVCRTAAAHQGYPVRHHIASRLQHREAGLLQLRGFQLIVMPRAWADDRLGMSHREP